MKVLLLFIREGVRALADPKPHPHSQPWNGRCTKCGHRLGDNVRPSRELPPWQWPVEIWGRAKAIRHGGQ